MRIHYKALLILSGLMACAVTSNVTAKSKKLSLKNAAKAATEANDSLEFAKSLEKAKVSKGMFDVYLNKKGELYFALPDSAFDKTYLLVNRINSLSNTADYVSGQMCGDPKLIRFSKDDGKVYMHLVQSTAVVDPSDPIAPSFARNFLDPVVKGFKIEDTRDGKTYIDVSNFFTSNDKLISPIKETSPIAKLLGAKDGIKGTFYSDGSSVTSMKSFPENIEIESRLAYTTSIAAQPYTVVMSRSILALPDDPMPQRYQDNRVGYFYELKSRYSSDADRMKPFTIINRHRMEPKQEDMEAYFRGELVEPKKKIVFYVDSAFPEKWAPAVMEGIEYWNKAFEAAGFKNAVEARPYPKNDPDFDPDDIRYSCVRYCVTPTANAMGPSYTDPRTGEILGADVIWYHNILSLVHDWRFTQTAAVDPRVRTQVFADSVMYESLTYVAAHEIGHCLGLMHNMGASHSFSIDNLRDPEFTQKHGTTPSIMDYARNNFVAQPGDLERGVRLTPPPIGVYDIYAINWGYRLIPGAKTPDDEKNTLDKWIREHDGDAMYEFGAQQMMGLVDPTDQTEDLSNDHIAAGNLAISNLKIIMDNFEEWAADPDNTYEPLLDTYKAMVKQYQRHVGHVFPYIGGIRFKEIRQGNEDGAARNFIDRAQQKKAMDWLLSQARTCTWLAPKDLMIKWDEPYEWIPKVQKSIVGCLLSSGNLNRINEGGIIDPVNNYTLDTYIDDAIKGIFAATYAGKKLDAAEKNMQSAAIAAMIKHSGLNPAPPKSTKAIDADVAYEEMVQSISAPAMPCSHSHIGTDADQSRDFFRVCLAHQSPLPAVELNPLMTAQLRKVMSLYRSKRTAVADVSTRNFYDYQIQVIDKVLNPK